jgi:hypothetical protein
MTIIVTVHGTSAGDAEDEGQHWWQRNSDFQKRLSSWLDLTGVRIEPFHWGSGPNSEVARRAAGQELFKKLRQFEEFGESYLLIGHSHGGSVIYHALIEAAGKQHELPHLKQWITIGTPFISMRRKRLTFRRLNDIGKIAYIFMLMSIISLVSVPNIYVHGKEFFKSMFPMELLDVGVAGILIWSCLYPIVIYRILRLLEAQTRRRYSEATGRFLVDHFLSRWQSLRSRDDEAINVLRSTKPLKVSLFDRLVLTGPAKNFLVFFMILMFSMWLVLSLPLIGRDIGLTPAYFDQIYTMFPLELRGLKQLDLSTLAANPIDLSVVWGYVSAHPWSSLAWIAGFAGLLPLLLGFAFIFVWLELRALHGIAYLFGIPASWWLNTSTASRLKNKAFGNDTIGEYVEAVGSMPGICHQECGAIPEDVEAALRTHVEKSAVIALARARRVLGLSSRLPDRGDIAQILADQLTGSELIHTAYFEVDAFSKLIAIGIHRACGVDLSSEFKKTENCEALFSCFEQTKLPASAEVCGPEFGGTNP